MPELLTVGETCAVFSPTTVGRLRYAGGFDLRMGGAECTVAIGVARLGFTAGWISWLGDDELGRYIRSQVQGEGVDVSHVALVPETQTGIIVRERLPGGTARNYYYRKDSAFTQLTEQSIDADYFAQTKILHLTGITPALSEKSLKTTFRLVQIAKERGVTITFDPNMRLKLWRPEVARPVLDQLSASADYVLAGMEDLQGYHEGIKSERDAIDRLVEVGCQNIVLKLGSEGALLASNGSERLFSAYPVAGAVDVMGAGDAFAAGFIAGLLRGLGLADAVDLGNAVAGFSIQMPGNYESLPTWSEVAQFKKGRSTITR